MTDVLVDYRWVALALPLNVMALTFDMYVLSHPSLFRRFKQLPRFIRIQAVTFVVVPLLISPFLPQPRFLASWVITGPTGFGLITLGVALLWGAFVKIGVVPGFRHKSNLLIAGVYGLIRHPIYSGTLFAFLGLSLALHALISMLYWPVSVLLYLGLTVIEERQLIAEYGDDYKTYKSKVKARLIPFIL